MNSPTRQLVLDAAAHVIAVELPDAWAIYVYGSMARNDATSTSDIDIAVLLPPLATFPDKLGLTARAAAVAGREVDIVDLRRANLDLVHAVLREGLPLLVRNEDKTLAWEAERMTDYALFNPRRADIVEEFLRAPLGAAT